MFESQNAEDAPSVDMIAGSADAASRVEELDTSSVADAIAAAGLEGRLLGARRLLLAVTWADQHVPACQQQRAGHAGAPEGRREIVCGCQESGSTSTWQRRLRICRRPGSDGTPAVSASGVAEYAVHSGTTTLSGSRALGEALDLRHRHPRLWRRVMAGEVEEWQARRVARLASWLSRDEVDRVDAATADAVGKLPWGRCLDVVEAAVIAADPEGHDERRREQDERCYVSAGRYRGTDAKGNRTLVARTSASNVARLDALVQHLADLLGAAGDRDTDQVRRAKAIGLLANPAQVCVLLGETVTPDLISDLVPGRALHPTVPSTTLPPALDGGTGCDREPGGLAPGWFDADGSRPQRDPELDLDLEEEPEPEPEPPTAVQLAAEFGRVLSGLAQEQGDRSAWDLLRPQTTLVFHLSEDGIVARMSDASGPLGPIGLRQLRDQLSEQLPAWLVDHLDGEHPPRSRLVDTGAVSSDGDSDSHGADPPPGERSPGGSHPDRRGRGTSLPGPSPLGTGAPGTGAPGTGAPGTGAPGGGQRTARGDGTGASTAPAAPGRSRRRRLRLRDQIVVRPVLDVAGQTPVDAYEVPARMREAVVESSAFEIFPWGTAEARRCQLDHTTPYLRGKRQAAPDPADTAEGVTAGSRTRGQTRPDNLGPLSVGHHNLKTHLGWRCHQPLPGLYLWQTPSGHWFRIDHTGTTPLGRERPEILRQREAARASNASRSFVETALASVLVEVA